ncbi:trypsin-like serine protease [Pontiella sp.]|uniref:trypsin-like serine protease n=1 Tax=Pontiella sp. TaxID=2837462 RepID=UPI003565D797
MNMKQVLTEWVVLGVAGLVCTQASAIAVSDYAVAEAAPSNTVTGAGMDWSFIYNYRDATAVAVDHYWVLTAAHVADDFTSHTKSNLTINGETYYQQEEVFHPTADLALVRYDKPFPGYYALHSGEIYSGPIHNRVYQELLMVGYGYKGAVYTDHFSQTSGQWSRRWGTNRGEGESPVSTNVGDDTGLAITTCLQTAFDLSDTSYEAGANIYDSGGGVFINVSGEWKLTGINLYRYGTSPEFEGNWAALIPDYISWIKSVITDYDSDMDGLPDHWESSTGETDAAADPDLDGFTNYEEWIADTDPTAYSSHLKIETYTNATNMAFSSSSDREYLIEYCTDLTNMNWQTEQDWFSAGGTQTVQAVSTADTNRFYRVRVKLP